MEKFHFDRFALPPPITVLFGYRDHFKSNKMSYALGWKYIAFQYDTFEDHNLIPASSLKALMTIKII